MMSSLTFITNVSIICFLMCGATDALKEGSTISRSDSPKGDEFGISLYQILSEQVKGNLLVSPISVQLILALTYTGGKGRVADEIATALRLPNDKKKVLQGHKFLLESFQTPALVLWNKIFVESSATLNKGFQVDAAKYFFAAAVPVDFKNNPEEGRHYINELIKNKTHERIHNVLVEGSVTSDTRLILINAIHFKTKWLRQFDCDDTYEEEFFVTPQKTIQVEMMHAKGKYRFKRHQRLKAKILEIPYDNPGYSMMIVLPDSLDGLNLVEENLHTFNLTDEITQLSKTTVNIGLPKFRLENTLDLETTLAKLGMPSLFKEPDLSGIAEGDPILVSKVIQKGYIQVNEEGTEASGVSAVLAVRRLALNEEFFIANHPFLIFILYHNAPPIFMARIVNI